MSWVSEEIRATRDTLRYGFAVGKVRVLEARTLDRSAYERLLDARDFQEQRRILSETVYGEFLENAETVEDVERGLDDAIIGFESIIDQAELPEPMVRFFRLRADYQNLKAAVKARLLGAPLEGLTTRRGSVAPELFDADMTSLPSAFATLAGELMSASEMGAELADIDARVDMAQFRALHRAADDARSPFLRKVATLLSDMANTRVLVRAYSSGLPPTRVRDLLVPGGSVPEQQLMSWYGGSPVELAQALERFGSVRGVSTEDIIEPGVIDVLTDNALLRLLRTSRYIAAGPEPVIAYVLAREFEVQALRVLLMGKLSGLDQEALRHRLRNTYR